MAMQSSAELLVRAAAVPTRIANQACRICDEGAAATVLSVQRRLVLLEEHDVRGTSVGSQLLFAASANAAVTVQVRSLEAISGHVRF